MAPDDPMHTLHGIIRQLLSLHAEEGHPPLDTHRIDRRIHTLCIGSSDERRLRSFLPQCHLSYSNLHVLTPRHVFTPLPTNRQGTLARSEYRNTSFGIASQDKGPMLTLLALLALRAVLHSSEPHFTRHGTCVNHAFPPRLPFTLDVELGRETVLHGDLATLVLHICSNIISSKDFCCTSTAKT